MGRRPYQGPKRTRNNTAEGHVIPISGNIFLQALQVLKLNSGDIWSLQKRQSVQLLAEPSIYLRRKHLVRADWRGVGMEHPTLADSELSGRDCIIMGLVVDISWQAGGIIFSCYHSELVIWVSFNQDFPIAPTACAETKSQGWQGLSNKEREVDQCVISKRYE